MKKITTLLTCAAFILSPAAYGADTDQPKVVGQASQDGVNAAKRRTWIAFAVAAVIVGLAAVALVVVAKDKGKKGRSSH